MLSRYARVSSSEDYSLFFSAFMCSQRLREMISLIFFLLYDLWYADVSVARRGREGQNVLAYTAVFGYVLAQLGFCAAIRKGQSAILAAKAGIGIVCHFFELSRALLTLVLAQRDATEAAKALDIYAVVSVEAFLVV